MRYVLIASLALAQTIPAQAQGNRPKFTRASSFALGLECEMRKIAKSAAKDGIFIKKVSGKLTLDRTSKQSSGLGITATVPFEVFEFGPSVNFTDTNSQTSAVDFDFEFNASDPLPTECANAKMQAYAVNGRLLGQAKFAPLPPLKSIYQPREGNDRVPSTYVLKREFGTEVKVNAGYTINLLFIKIERQGGERQVAATAKYDVTAQVDKVRTLAALRKKRSR